MPELKICLLGRFHLIVDGMPVEESRWTRKKSKTLVKVLALAPGFSMHREQLLEILWPEMETDAALNNLHKVIHAARRVLEPVPPPTGSTFLLTQDSLVSLASAALVVDSFEFERLAGAAIRSGDSDAMQAAVELYTGDLLEEDLYEDWASLHRERLRLLFQRLLTGFAEVLEASGDVRTVDVLHRLLATNRANEDAHRRLMKLHASRGERYLALQQYQACREALRQDLDAEPEASTVRLYERLLAGEPERVTAAPAVVQHVSSEVQGLKAGGQTDAPLPASPNRREIIAVTTLGALGLAGWAIHRGANRSRPLSGINPSLAILPLRVQPVDPQQEVVADGISEELINSISRLNGIRVMARGTVFSYKGRGDALAVGRELKVNAVVFGYLRQEGTNTAVGMELIDVTDGSRLWARRYSAKTANISPLQPLLNSELEIAVKANLAGQQVPQPVRSGTQDAESYRLYLAGRSFWNQRTPEGFRRSIDYYKQALDRDATYALAWAGLADSYGLLGWQSGLPRDHFPRAREAAQKALQLDQSLAEAQTTLAMVSALYDWNWVAAEAQFRRATELNRGYATAHHWYGVHLAAQGRLNEARRELGIALDLDPLSPIVNVNVGYPAYYERRYREARVTFTKALSLNSSFAPAHEDLMTVNALEGNPAGAASEAYSFLKFSGQEDIATAVQTAAGRGEFQTVLKSWLAVVEKDAAVSYVSPMIPARLAAGLGDKAKSFHWLGQALTQRCPQLVYLAADPRYDVLRSDQRFIDLLRQIGLPPK